MRAGLGIVLHPVRSCRARACTSDLLQADRASPRVKFPV